MFRVDPRNYARSYPTQRYDAFLSHEWQSSQFAKFLSLLIIFNSRAAAVASLVVSIAQGLYWSLSEALPQPWTVLLGHLAWIIVLFSWQHFRALLCRPVTVFLDKFCIAQHSDELKAKGILGIAAFLLQSRKLVVLWTPRYFSRLWCTYELTTFLQAQRRSDAVVMMPLKMSMLLFLFSAFWHLLILSYYFWQELLDGWLDDQDWEETRPLFMLYLVCLQVGLTALVLPPVNYLGLGLVRDLDELPRQLATFRVQDASCFCCSNGHRNPITGEQLPCDRELVHQTLRGWYRQTSESTDHEQALDFFNELVQSRLSTSVLSSMTTSLPLGWVLSIVGVCHVPIVVSLQSQIVRLWSMYGVWDDLPGLVAFTLRSLIECTYPLLLLLLAARLFLPLLRARTLRRRPVYPEKKMKIPRMRDSSIYLLDDPYSALDSRVAWRCHEEMVAGQLSRKTRIVAMNRLEFLSSCDQVVVMSNGQIEAAGRYQEVVRSSSVLQALLKSQGLAERAQAQTEMQPPNFSRAVSASSAGSAADGQQREEDDEDDEEAEGLEEEERATGQVKTEVFKYYFRAMGGWCRVSFLAALYLGSELVTLSLPVWLAVWTAASTKTGEVSLELTMHYLSVYVILSILVIILATLRDLAGNVYGFMAARRLHLAMWTSVLRAPMSFFQDTPQGRIINRFSKDMSEIDKEVIWNIINTFVPVLGVLGNFAMVAGIAYYAVLAFLPAFYFYYKLWKYFNKAVLDVKRISKVQGSHVYDHFNNLCRENAISVVRAFRQAEQQCRMSDGFIVDQQRPDYTQLFLSAWFSLRIEMLGSILTLLVSVFITLGHQTLVSASTTALVLNFAGECAGSIEQLIGQVAAFSMAFNCVERVRHYAEELLFLPCANCCGRPPILFTSITEDAESPEEHDGTEGTAQSTAETRGKELPSEAPVVTASRPPPGWPDRGVLKVKNLQLRYKPHLPLVLKGLSFSLKEGERVGVETLRYNCDPFDQHRAEDIWAALEEAQLAPWVRRRGGEARLELQSKPPGW
eukprot:s1073_g2.t1